VESKHGHEPQRPSFLAIIKRNSLVNEGIIALVAPEGSLTDYEKQSTKLRFIQSGNALTSIHSDHMRTVSPPFGFS
jgi:hypothetical protein